MMPFVLAHQGGWDEFLMFAVPVALGWWAIKAAERRSRRRAEEAAGSDRAPDSSVEKTSTDGPAPRDS